MKYFLYVLENRAGRYYIGHTNNLERRIAEHNDISRRSWTARQAPWELIFATGYGTRSDAMREEKRLKLFKNKTSLAKFMKGG